MTETTKPSDMFDIPVLPAVLKALTDVAKGCTDGGRMTWGDDEALSACHGILVERIDGITWLVATDRYRLIGYQCNCASEVGKESLSDRRFFIPFVLLKHVTSRIHEQSLSNSARVLQLDMENRFPDWLSMIKNQRPNDKKPGGWVDARFGQTIALVGKAIKAQAKTEGYSMKKGSGQPHEVCCRVVACGGDLDPVWCRFDSPHLGRSSGRWRLILMPMRV